MAETRPRLKHLTSDISLILRESNMRAVRSRPASSNPVLRELLIQFRHAACLGLLLPCYSVTWMAGSCRNDSRKAIKSHTSRTVKMPRYFTDVCALSTPSLINWTCENNMHPHIFCFLKALHPYCLNIRKMTKSLPLCLLVSKHCASLPTCVQLWDSLVTLLSLCWLKLCSLPVVYKYKILQLWFVIWLELIKATCYPGEQ